MEGRQVCRYGQGQGHQRPRAPVGQVPVRPQGGGLPLVLPRPVSDERGAAVLHPPERGLPVQPHRHPVLPEDQGTRRHRPEQDLPVLQPDVRDGPCRQHRPGLHDAAARCHRLPGHPAERLPQLPAERRQRQEDIDLHHQEGRRPAGGHLQEPADGPRGQVGQPQALHRVRHAHGREVLRPRGEIRPLQEHGRQVLLLRRVQGGRGGQPDGQGQEARVPVRDGRGGPVRLRGGRQVQGL